jgi:hypothetical protein
LRLGVGGHSAIHRLIIENPTRHIIQEFSE